MKTIHLDTKEAPNKFWAALDARQRNLNNKSLWSAKEQLRAERMLMALTTVYNCKNSHISYGKKAISIKLDKPRLSRADHLVSLEEEWSSLGVIKKVSDQGILYTFQ